MNAPAAQGEQHQPQQEDYTPSCVLVTGGAGFIGSHVAARFVERGYKVVVLDKLDACASLRALDALRPSPRFKFVRGDVMAADLVTYVLQKEAVDTVVHCAAQTHVEASFGNSLAFTLNNTYGTHVLLECARLHGRVRRFINVSTDEVNGPGPAAEGILAPTNPYAAAKAGAELMGAAYHASWALPVLTTRSCNVYGGGQFVEKLVPKFIVLASRKQPLPVHGGGTATRSYLHVRDVVDALDAILHKGTVGETYTIGPGRERSVKDVAADVCACFGLDVSSQLTSAADRSFLDQRSPVADPKLAALGWRPRVPWENGLPETVDWYARHASGWWDRAAVEEALEAHPHIALPPAGPG